jgi:hypothetical protein
LLGDTLDRRFITVVVGEEDVEGFAVTAHESYESPFQS